MQQWESIYVIDAVNSILCKQNARKNNIENWILDFVHLSMVSKLNWLPHFCLFCAENKYKYLKSLREKKTFCLSK